MIALLCPHLLHPTVGDSAPSPAAGSAGRMETGTSYLATWVCLWHAVDMELLFGQEPPSRGYLYTTQQVASEVFKFSSVAGLCCWQHWRARAGVAGWGTLYGCQCHSPKWDRQHGLSASLACLVLGLCYRACSFPQC